MEIVHNGRVNLRAIAVYLPGIHEPPRPPILTSPNSRLGFRPTPATLYGHLNPHGKYRFDLDEDLHGAELRPLRTPGDNP